ncbi:hypothetical protein [Wansuia hejianensis]|uniref:Uncharacterized protein n=1 Tax=Wansuia hejianensis TaxID=2763667 RepID=A0A926F0S3_9FIRM|nr:hypothetical protein [Wansuia hejianensis]MBC8591261.1 hypothetical protein [Wansuia hejianensis]
MTKLDLEKILLSMFQEDISSKGKNTYMSQLAVISIKSLLPSKEFIGNKIDYKRFEEELKLWKYYRIGESQSLLNILEEIDEEIYFQQRDKSIGSRIIPIIVGNMDYNIIEDEVIRNIIFTTGNIRDLLEWISISKIIHMGMEDRDNIIEELKEYLINLSQIEFLNKYEGLYRVSLSNYPGKFQIDFEREKVSIISLLNGIPINKYKHLLDILNIMDGMKASTFLGKVLYSSFKEIDTDYNLPVFYKNMNNYILRLRKSRIDPSKLIIKEYILPDIFTFEENQVFFHSLLKESKVIKKEASDNKLTSIIQTKTGIYIFRRDPI